jgi:cytidylate kinase
MKTAAWEVDSRLVMWLTLEAPVVLHYLKAPMAVKLTGVCFIAF